MPTTTTHPERLTPDSAKRKIDPELEKLARTIREQLDTRATESRAHFLEALRSGHDQIVKWRRSEASELAKFRFDNSRDLTRLRYVDPTRAVRTAMAELPAGFMFEWTPEQIREAHFWMQFVEALRAPVTGFYLGPVLDDYGPPYIAAVGSQVTLLGARLGTAAGTAVLVDCNGVQHQLTVDSWSETAVLLTIPATISGVPFDCAGRIELQLPGGEQVSANVIIEPLSGIFWSTDTYAQSDYSFLDTYSADRDFKSADLPPSFREFILPDSIDNLHTGAVAFKISNTLVTRFDGGVHVSITRGPVVESNRLVVSTHLADDHLWNFVVTAEFYITVPNGIPAPGWSSN